MSSLSSPADARHAGSEQSPPLSAPTIVVLVALMAATWIAAGSFGLLGHPLRHALTWVALAVAIVTGWPRLDRSLTAWVSLAAAVLAAIIMTAADPPVVNVLAVSVVAAALAGFRRGLPGRAILMVGLATIVLAIFRLALDSTAAVWLLADSVGRALGQPAAWIAGRPLWVGASFGGIDFLVLMAALYVGWLRCTSPPRLARAVYAAVAILCGHLVYLVVLACSGDLLAALPKVVLPEPSEISRVGVWAWGNSTRTLLPWNLPVLAGIIHLGIAAAMFRWAPWLPAAELEVARPAAHAQQKRAKGFDLSAGFSLWFVAVVLAALVPVITVLGPSKSDLSGKTVIVHDQGYLKLLKPEYDDYKGPPEPFGVLRMFVESLGGTLTRSADLSELAALSDADARATILVLLHPDRPWDDEHLKRVWEFVRRGGSLLLVAGPTVFEGGSGSSFNDVLRPTAMYVRYDTAVPAAEHWEHCLQTSLHPAAAGIHDRRNRFGLSLGSSIRVCWPARPVLVGRWGWSDPGSDAADIGRYQYEPGEKLGDLVLAAQQQFGQGTIIVLGDSTSFENEVLANSYVFTGRLLGYLAGGTPDPQAWWRQLLGLLVMVVLVGVLAWRAEPFRLALAACALALSLASSVAANHRTASVLPDGREHTPNNVAYIDASHLEAYCTDTWDDFGLGGLSRALSRSGYLPLMLPEVTAERLERAGLLICIAPARPFSPAERSAIGEFVRGGGGLICTVGAEEAAGSRELLADFGFRVLPSPVPPGGKDRETTPLGDDRPIGFAYYEAGTEKDNYKAAVQPYAPWEIDCSAKDAKKIVWWPEGGKETGRKQYFLINRPVGRGMVGVIGDTFLAVNQNLESQASVIPQNVVFWRWYLSLIGKRKQWIPPDPNPPGPSTSDTLPDELPPVAPPPATPRSVAPADRRPQKAAAARSEVAP